MIGFYIFIIALLVSVAAFAIVMFMTDDGVSGTTTPTAPTPFTHCGWAEAGEDIRRDGEILFTDKASGFARFVLARYNPREMQGDDAYYTKKAGLIPGNLYYVDGLEVGGFYTRLTLKGIRNAEFNSVDFTFEDDLGRPLDIYNLPPYAPDGRMAKAFAEAIKQFEEVNKDRAAGDVVPVPVIELRELHFN